MRTNPFQPLYDLCNAQTAEEKAADLPDMPRYVDVELTNRCNFRCLFCVTGTRQHKRGRGDMDDALFRSLLDQCAEHGVPMRFVRWGEPFLHPRIMDYLQACRDRGVMTHVTTNGSLLDEDALRRLVDIPLDSIKFSFQGVDRESYRAMRNKDFFEGLMDTIAALYRLRGDREAPYIHASTSVTDESAERREAFAERIARITDSHNLGRTVLDRVDPEQGTLSEEERALLRRLKDNDKMVKAHFQCHQVYDVLSVNWDGTVSACCGDYDNLMLVGDLREATLAELWRSPRLERYRAMLARMRHDELPLCRICYDMNQKRIKNVQNL